jgi:hypothetical protein
MKLTVIDHADPSVGLFEASYEVETPFNDPNDSIEDEDELNTFKEMIIQAYAQFSIGRVSAFYEFEKPL